MVVILTNQPSSAFVDELRPLQCSQTPMILTRTIVMTIVNYGDEDYHA